MDTEAVIQSIHAALPEAQVQRLENPGPAQQHSVLVDASDGLAVALHLRDAAGVQLDYCSNVTGVDWLDREVEEVVTVEEEVDGEIKQVKQKLKRTEPGYLEAVYHLYSMQLKQGPVVLRMRTANRSDNVTLPSLTPVWKSADFQEREVYDLYGIRFKGHPDLRRLLMWEEFEGHPMRKDFEFPEEDLLPEGMTLNEGAQQ